MVIARNENIILRLLEKSDLDSLTLLANNPKIGRNLRNGFPYPYELKNAIDFYALIEGQNPKSFFAIEYAGNFCGMISLMPLTDVYCKTAEIGYWLGEPFWNKGIMTKAVALILDWGWKNLDIVRIHTGIYSYNPASARVLEKAGFRFECEFVNSIYKNGQLLNELRYSILKPE
jgi:[ribosomal protein S5]-alanine N-acetyltransferase